MYTSLRVKNEHARVGLHTVT